MAQGAKELAATPDDWSLIPETHMLVGGNHSLPTACPLSSVCVQRHKQTIQMKGNRKALKAGRQQSKIQGDSLYVGELTKENKVERSEGS